jgi:hypothetical protein
MLAARSLLGGKSDRMLAEHSRRCWTILQRLLGIVTAVPGLDQTLSLAQCREGLSIEQFISALFGLEVEQS